jgi:hypothetical protein
MISTVGLSEPLAAVDAIVLLLVVVVQVGEQVCGGVVGAGTGGTRG